jgi:hypothetical protein
VFHAKVEHKQALTMTEATSTLTVPDRVWAVGALCRAVADALEARFSPVTVRGELTGFSRAASGHCYFSIKDAQGQVAWTQTLEEKSLRILSELYLRDICLRKYVYGLYRLLPKQLLLPI